MIDEIRTKELILGAQEGNRQATQTLIEENSGLIWSIVRRYFGRGCETDDLYQLACIGFIKAVRDFDIHYGTQFSTYAVYKISGEIRRFLRDDGMIKVSRTIRDKYTVIATARRALANRLGCEPKLSELAAETGFSAEEIAVCDCALQPADSLQREISDDGMTREMVLGTEDAEEGILDRLSLRDAVSELPERERNVILLRYFRGMTQENAARVLSISQVQVSRIERRALEHLRGVLTG